MQEHFHFTTDKAKIQKQYAAIFFFVSAQLSQIQCYLQRRNRHLAKQEEAVIIAIHLLGLASLPNVHGIALLLGTCSRMDVFSNVLDTIAVAERCALRSNGFVMNERNVGNTMPTRS